MPVTPSSHSHRSDSRRNNPRWSRYAAARRAGLRARDAYRTATHPAPVVDYRTDTDGTLHLDSTRSGDRAGQGDGARHGDGAGWPELAGLDITVTAVPDPSPDLSWLGEFSDRWRPQAVVASHNDPAAYRYFHPAIGAAEHRAAFSAGGYARGVAWYLAQRAVRRDMEQARSGQEWIITVTIAKAGAVLGEASLGGVDIDPDRDHDEQIAEAAVEYGLVDEAAWHAQRTLAALTACRLPAASPIATRLRRQQS